MRYLSVVMLSIVLLLSACESEEPVEDTPPAITIPPEIPIKLSLDQNPLFYEWVFGEDAEDGKILYDFDFSDIEFRVPGTYTATCTVTDPDGENSTSSFGVVIEDKTPPKVQKMDSIKEPALRNWIMNLQ